jgi:hypothetical protein
MSRELIEHITSGNMLEANDMVEAKLAEIRERKMYEMKRMFAAKMDEALGGMSKADIEARRKAGYVKAADVLPDPRDTKISMTPGEKKKKVVIKKKLNEDNPIPQSAMGYIEARRKEAEKESQSSQSAGKEKPKPKRKASASKLDYPNTPGGRNRKKLDQWVAKNPPGSGVLKATKGIGSGLVRASNSPLAKDLQDIGNRNL